MDFSELKHTRRELDGGGRVVVLDTGAIITPEAEAMLQALHSRSLGGIDSHLVKLAKKGAKDFMDTYYVGYGDKSIGDCGTVTIFIEGVSMLAAKAVQDFQLYNGQESSTRYIDYAKQPFIDPQHNPQSQEMLESLRAFYLEGLETMKQELAKRHPRKEAEDEKIWKKAINARAFDIMRGFLPAGASTNLAWHTELRHAADHLMRLRNHPLPEVRAIAEKSAEALDEHLPSSFKQKRYETTEKYVHEWMHGTYYFDAPLEQEMKLEHDGVDHALLSTYKTVLASRPVKTEMPKIVAECGTLRFSFLLDYGSFRDLQRHRALVQRMPLLSTKRGFEEWMFEQMPDPLAEKAREYLAGYEKKLPALKLSPEELQYYIPMGYRVRCRFSGDLPAISWLVELRSGIAVHPTLRVVAQHIAEMLLKKFAASELVLHIDGTEDLFNYKRGAQDIIEKI